MSKLISASNEVSSTLTLVQEATVQCLKLAKLSKLEAYQESLLYATRCRSLYEVQQLLKVRIEDLEKELNA